MWRTVAVATARGAVGAMKQLGAGHLSGMAMTAALAAARRAQWPPSLLFQQRGSAAANFSSVHGENSMQPAPRASLVNCNHSQPHPEQLKLTQLKAWLTRHGARFDKLQLRALPRSSDGASPRRGLFVAQNVPAGEALLRVPESCILGSRTHQEQSAACQALQRGDVREHSNVLHGAYLACLLLEERAKGNKSFFAPYIATLPTEYSGMPTHFSEKEFRLLKGSCVLHQIQLRKHLLQEEYKTVCAVLDKADLSGSAPHGHNGSRLLMGPFSERHSFADWLWARHTVDSRSFQGSSLVTNSDGIVLRLMVPLADMVNHQAAATHAGNSAGCNVAFDIGNFNDSFANHALRNMRAGEELQESYGPRCNSRFLLHYGFCLADNEAANEVVLHMRIDAPYDSRVAFSAADRPAWIRSQHRLLEVAKGNVSVCAHHSAHNSRVALSASDREALIQSKQLLLPRSENDVPDAAATPFHAMYWLPNSFRSLNDDGIRLCFQFSSGLHDGPAKSVLGVVRALMAQPDCAATPLLDALASSIIASRLIQCSNSGTPDLALVLVRNPGAHIDALEQAAWEIRKKLKEVGESHTGLTETQTVEVMLACAQDVEDGRHVALRCTPPLSVRNELAVLRCLADAAETALKGFDTSAEEDERILRADAALSSLPSNRGLLSVNERYCVLMRLGEKRGLHRLIDIEAEALAIVKEFTSMVRNNCSPEHLLAEWESHVRQILKPRLTKAGSWLYFESAFLPLVDAIAQEESVQRRVDMTAKIE